VPLVDVPLTPESKAPLELISAPETPALPLVAEVLLNVVSPLTPLPSPNPTPRIAGPVLSFSYSMHGLELEHEGSGAGCAVVRCTCPAPIKNTTPTTTGIIDSKIHDRLINMFSLLSEGGANSNQSDW
jgi:hypothetical protein